MSSKTRKKYLGLAAGLPALVTAGLLAGGATSASAVEGPGSVNVSTTAVPPLPGTTRNVDAWKLVGIPGPNTGASGSQIAPQWIVTARHNAPPVGTIFKNALGSAKIDATYVAPNGGSAYNCADPSGGPDLSISHLATAIAAPAGGFPTLLSDRLPTGDSAAQVPGYVLSAGQGGENGYIKAVWTDTSSATVADPTQSANAIVGDSGSASYWYPTPTSTPVLANVIVSAGKPFAQATAQLGGACGPVADLKTWVTSVVQNFPTSSGPKYATLDAVSPKSTWRPAVPSTPTVNATTANSAFLVWGAPPADGTPAPPAYQVRLQPGNIVVNAGNLLNTTVTGLTPGTTYTATVSSVNANGLSLPVVAQQYDDSTVTQFVTSPAPDALTGLTYEPYTTIDSYGLDGCVHLAPAVATTGVQGGRIGAVDYAIANAPLRTASSTLEYCHLPLGQQTPIFVSAFNGLTSGPAKLIWVTAPAKITGEPLAVKANGRVTTLSTGAKLYLADVSWSAPNAPTNPATLLGYTVTITSVSSLTPTYSQTVRTTADQTTWSALGLSPNGIYQVRVSARYDRVVPGSDSPLVTAETPA